jgi:biopolymer transport protein ExbB/TolQ
LGINIGDLVYQLIMFILLLGMIFAVYFFVRSLLARSNKSNRMEQKLDRVIELLEKDKRE